jgi:hypothetical protein
MLRSLWKTVEEGCDCERRLQKRTESGAKVELEALAISAKASRKIMAGLLQDLAIEKDKRLKSRITSIASHVDRELRPLNFGKDDGELDLHEFADLRNHIGLDVIELLTPPEKIELLVCNRITSSQNLLFEIQTAALTMQQNLAEPDSGFNIDAISAVCGPRLAPFTYTPSVFISDLTTLVSVGRRVEVDMADALRLAAEMQELFRHGSDSPSCAMPEIAREMDQHEKSSFETLWRSAQRCAREVRVILLMPTTQSNVNDEDESNNNAKGQIRFRGHTVKAMPQTLKILKLFLERKTIKELKLVEHIWGEGNGPENGTLKQAICRCNKAFVDAKTGMSLHQLQGNVILELPKKVTELRNRV